MNKSFKPEYLCSGTWSGNSLRFATREEARMNADYKMDRWLVPTDCRVVESADEVNYKWVNNTLLPIGAKDENLYK